MKKDIKKSENKPTQTNPFSDMEKEVLDFWEKGNIFKKSVEKKSPQPLPTGQAGPFIKGGNNKDYVFYDGPPFATGTPHYGHIVASIMKDVVPRYWTMQGYRVERRWGWDCHGLPIENIVEKEMGSKSKKDIEKLGVEKFNELCRSKVLGYVDEWKKVIKRLGRWADMENSYKTMDLDYMESVWWVFKELYDRGLIYEGYRSMHICPRCETTLSQQEVAEGYKDIKDLSAIAKFELANPSELDANLANDKVYVLAWTTTPWTLIGNVALAVGGGIDYVLVSILGEGWSAHEKKPNGKVKLNKNILQYYILAKDRIEDILVKQGKDFEIIKELKGKDLIGKKYKPLFDYYAKNEKLENHENGWKIYAADFVTTEEGTGVVHIAPAFGEDDLNLGKEKNLPFIQHVGMDGIIKKEVKDFACLSVKPIDDHMKTDIDIIKYLAHNNLLFSKEKYEHSYPHCWRCDTPLINYATSSWFVGITKIKDKMLETAKEINWSPKHIKEGRFGKWLEGARDWSISRQRFWASVIPIWVCNKCGEKKVIGSVKKLEELSGEKITDLHKHIVDKITFPCEKCGGEMRRVPDVLDTWFDSGSMPYAQMHYPFENKEKFEENFPAEFIAEGIDQTRAWFYYLHSIANGIKDSHAFKNVIVNGIVLAEDGKKMSKKLNNYPDPMVVMDKYGADSLRYYLCASPVMKADNINFFEKDLAEQTRFFNTLLNVLSFYKMFAQDIEVENLEQNDLANILDIWITSRLEETKRIVTERMDNYNLHAIREIPVFINDLSTWYVRRSRDRFKGDDQADKMRALKTLRRTLYHLARIMAPFMPFIAEHIYQELGADIESVHLKEWPEVKKEWMNEKVIAEMEIVRKIVELGLAKRDEAGIKVRQPLQQLTINNLQLTIKDELLNLVKDEVNVKDVKVKKGEGDLAVELDTKLTPELKMEGTKREIVRAVNNLRKDAGMTIKDRAVIYYETDSKEIKNVFDKLGEEILGDTLSERIVYDVKDAEFKKEVKVNGEEVNLGIKKV